MAVTYLLSFIYRTVLVKVMGVEYVGITGLCGNIINIFSLAELGVSWAISYHLYKPLSDADYKTVAAVVNLLRRIYRFIGAFIAITGLVVLPFLTTLVKSDKPIDHLQLIYILFLANTVLSYLFFAYYQILISADRKDYLLFRPKVLIPFICTIFQILVLVFFHNFLLTVILLCLSTLLKNLWMALIGNRTYPFLHQYKNEALGQELKKQIVDYIKATMIYKISLTLYQSASSIIISSFKGIAIYGIYSNFVLIVDTVKGVILNLINPLTSVIGEINAAESAGYKIVIYRRLNFLMEWICCFCSVCFLTLMNPFVEIWLGKEFTLPISTIILIVVFFYLEFITAFSTKFRDACGLNHIGKYRPVFTAVINIVLSLVLVNKMGLNGVLLAMSIARLTTITWFEPWIVHKNVFGSSVMEYYMELLQNLLITTISSLCVFWLSSFIWNGSVFSFILLCVICVIIPNVIQILVYRRNDAYVYYEALVVDKLHKI